MGNVLVHAVRLSSSAVCRIFSCWGLVSPVLRAMLPSLLLVAAVLAPWLLPPSVAHGSPSADLTDEEWASISERLRAAEYQATWQVPTGVDGVIEAWEAPNRANDLRILFAEDGVHVVPRRETTPSWHWRMQLVGVGREGSVRRTAAPQLVVRRNRIEYRRGDLVEWYVNEPRGLEQGFTLSRPPEGRGDTVILELALGGGLEPVTTDMGRSLVLRDEHGAVLGYRNLVAFDATGRELSAWLELDRIRQGGGPARLRIVVDDAGASYPLTIDPLISSEIAKLTASDGVVQDSFGISVGVSGDLVVIGASGDDDAGNGSGSAYVITRNQGGADGWGEVTKITAADGAAWDVFGCAVAVDGDTIVVGAKNDDDNGTNSGSAYVFERNQGGADNWGQVAKLTPSDGAEFDDFGETVAISGDTVVVGSWHDDVGAVTDQGSAYLFGRHQGGADSWGEVTKLVGSDSASGDWFSRGAVAIDGDLVVIGAADHAAGDGGAYVFVRNQGGADNWGELMKLTPSAVSAQSLFGSAVGVSGSTILVTAQNDDAIGGASGSAFVFERNQGGADNWGEVRRLTASDGEANDLFGESCAIDGDTIVVGARAEDGVGADSGAAYVFERNRGGADNWGEVQKLTASDSAAGDNFAYGLAISGDIIVAGAPLDDGAIGSSYVFAACGTDTGEWHEISKTTASDGWAGDLFGAAVGLNGDFMIVGAPMDDAPWNSNGSAYILHRNSGGADRWGEVIKITPSDAVGGERFGTAVAISGDTAVVGAFLDDPAGTSSGSAYVFSRNTGGPDNWGRVKKLIASDAAASDRFGESVAMSADTIVIGAPFENSQGAAYVFDRNLGGADNWGEVAKLVASDPGTSDTFGKSVAIEDDIVVVGSPQDNDDGSDSGSAYLFARNQGGADNWGQVRKLTAADATAGDRFGFAVSISHDTLAVSAYNDDQLGSKAGSAYVLERNQGGADNWGQVAKLTASDAAANDYFGYSLSISSDIVAVGAILADGAGADSGAVYVYERNHGGADAWGEVEKLVAADSAAGDKFSTVALDGLTLAVGAESDDDNGSDSGSSYVFRLSCILPPDLQLTKSDGDATATPGGVTAYTLDYTNVGGNAGGVELTDTVPAHTTFDSAASSPGWSCAPDNTPGSVCTLSVGSVAFAGGGSATFAVLVDSHFSSGVDELTNTASVNDDGAGGPDPTPGDNTDTETTPIDAAPDLVLAMDAGGASPLPGESVVYSLTYGNDGNQDADNVELAEVVPVATTFDPAASTAGWLCVPDNTAGSTCTLGIGSLAGGGSGGAATFAVVLDDPWTPGVTEIENTASIADDGLNGPDPNPGDNTATVIISLDSVPPTVVLVNSVPDTGDGQLAECESVRGVEITQLLVTFSEPVYDPPGDGDPHDVTNPANYLLVAAGDNLVVDTLGCGPVAGDDIEVPITAASYDGGSLTATVDLGASLEGGVLRFLACGSTSIRDIFANSLDGDGDGSGGDDFILPFRREMHNLLGNSHFDCSLEGWDVTETIPGAVNHGLEDADDSGQSGSAEIYSPSDTGVPESFSLSQCLPLTGPSGFSAGLKIKLQAAGGVSLDATILCELMSDSGCTGTTEALAVRSDSFQDTADLWEQTILPVFAPASGQSALCGCIIETATGSAFTAHLDQIELVPNDELIFVDGFETGATTPWSSTSY